MFLIKDIFNDRDILSRTIYGEARGELHKFGKKSLCAIANVVLNRLKQGRYGKSIKEICLKPYQFSCWNKNDPNYGKLNQLKILDSVFSFCESLAEDFLKTSSDTIIDYTDGATHYHHKAIKPYWADASLRTAEIGTHIFYKL